MTKAKATTTDFMRIWSAVEKTNPAHTKKVNQRGGFTAIDAHYQVMLATEQFGPVGEGWGYINGEPIFKDSLVFVPVTVWWEDRSKTFGPIYGGAEWVSDKGRHDNDALKKASTDGLTKALSHLGFNADVFLGKFDDNKYVESVRQEFTPPPPELEELDAFTKAIPTAATEDDLKALLDKAADAIDALANGPHAAKVALAKQQYVARKRALKETEPA